MTRWPSGTRSGSGSCRPAQEGFDTTTALGRLLLNLLAHLAKFEIELIRERVTVYFVKGFSPLSSRKIPHRSGGEFAA